MSLTKHPGMVGRVAGGNHCSAANDEPEPTQFPLGPDPRFVPSTVDPRFSESQAREFQRAEAQQFVGMFPGADA